MPKSRKGLSNAQVVIITAVLSAIGSILVAVIGVFPHLREPDLKKNIDLTAEINRLKQSVEDMKITVGHGDFGTSKTRNADVLAPHIQLRFSPVDPKTPEESYFTKGKLALTNSGFTGIENHEKVIFGFSKEYTGLVWGVSSNLVLFAVSGPDWQVADTKVENLKRGF